MSFSPDEVHFLIDNAHTVDSVTATMALTKKSMIADVAAARFHFGDYGRAVVELAGARRSVVGKLPLTWMMCQESAQQATPMQVAAVRAERFRSFLGDDAVAHDVTCSIGTEGHAVMQAGLDYIGADWMRPACSWPGITLMAPSCCALMPFIR